MGSGMDLELKFNYFFHLYWETEYSQHPYTQEVDPSSAETSCETADWASTLITALWENMKEESAKSYSVC